MPFIDVFAPDKSKPCDGCSPKQLFEALQAASLAVLQKKAVLNELNYYPVSDKDTGENLAQTLTPVVSLRYDNQSMSAVFHTISQTIFMNARGNSGVIFSIWMSELESFDFSANEFNFQIFCSLMVYGANKLCDKMDDVVPGTMVSLLQDVASDLSKPIQIKSALKVIAHALKRTQTQNTVLKAHHVVDSGALAVAIFLEHWIKYCFDSSASKTVERIEAFESKLGQDALHVHHTDLSQPPVFRYCTQAHLTLNSLPSESVLNSVQSLLSAHGDCDLMAVRQNQIHFHVHTNSTEALFTCLYDIGRVTQPKVEDMLMQYQATQTKDRIALVTDASADMAQHVKMNYPIYVLPMLLTFDGQSGLEPYTIDKADFYAKLDQFDPYPKTAAPNPQASHALFSQLSEYYEHILVITVSAKMSSTYHNLRQLSQSFKKITVFDSKSNSGGHGFLVTQAAAWIQQGLSLNVILSQLTALRQVTSIYVGVESLNAMIRSGRVSGLKALLLRIKKPKLILSMNAEGEGTIKKIFFFRKNVFKSLAQLIEKKYNQNPFKQYCILHVNNLPKAQWLAKQLKQFIQHEPVFIDCVSSVIGIHAGLGSVAVAFYF